MPEREAAFTGPIPTLNLREAEEDLAEEYRRHGRNPYSDFAFLELRYQRLLIEAKQRA